MCQVTNPNIQKSIKVNSNPTGYLTQKASAVLSSTRALPLPYWVFNPENQCMGQPARSRSVLSADVKNM